MERLPRILVVDDDGPILLLMKSLLREFKFDPSVASSGAEALTQVREARPDLVLVDRYMPGMSGDELIRRLRELEVDVPILVLSGSPLGPAEIEHLGANGAVLKPFELADLIGRIRSALGASGETTVTND